jgi:spore maturation protein CgeB
MKVLYIDLEFYYGIEARGANIIGQDGFKAGFETLGCEVTPFYYDSYLKNIRQLQVDLLIFADQVQPDLIFFSLFQDQLEHETLLKLKEKYVTINWFGDDQWRFNSFTQYYANDFTWCVTTDLFSIEKYKALGQENILLSQWGVVDTHELLPAHECYKYDVSFVGGYHPYRAWFISQLEKQGVSVVVFGYGWPNGPLSVKEMNKLFNESRINLNISNSNSLDIRYLTYSIKSFLVSFRSIKNNSQIKARNFEIPYFNGFQLSDYTPTLEQYFSIGQEIACYTNPDEAVLQINYYLENNDLRESIKKAGKQRASKEHGYSNRLREILKKINK